MKLAPYQAGRVSLVDDAAEGPLVHSVADSRSRRYLDEWEQRMLRSDADYELLMQSEAPIEPYVDSVLRGSQKQYATFLKDLRRRSLIRCIRRPKERVGVFCAQERWITKIDNRRQED